MDQHKEQVNHLLEDVWFFGNTLKNKSKSSKVMVRCNSDPCPSTSTKEDTLEHPSKMSNNPLHRTPSLPVSLSKDMKYELVEEDEEEYEPRMGDLIRQAMPMQINRRRLDRTPSLPPCRGTNNEGLSIGLNVDDGCISSGRKSSCRKVSVESSPFLQEKGPLAMVKLSRRTSLDSSLLLPPKCTSKGTKSANNSKNRTLKKLDHTKTQLEKSKVQKSSMDLPTEELQGFKNLALSSQNNDISPNVKQLQHGLQTRASLDSSSHAEISHLKRTSPSEPWRKPSTPLSGQPLVPKWSDQKASSSQDMKTQIKFWARAVASNVRQEC